MLVKPIASETELKYHAWVEHNRRYVDEKSGGKIGYVYIPDMGGDGIREFIKWFYPQIRKQGLIIDVRDNGGGNVSSMIIERLTRKLLGVNFGRNASATGTYPPQVILGAQQVSPQTLANAYAAMAAGGVLCQTRPVTSWNGRVAISLPDSATPITTETPQPR